MLLLPDLKTGVMLDTFHLVGKQPDVREWLKSEHKEEEMENHVFLSIWEEIPWGPEDVLIFSEHRRSSTSSSEH